MVESIACINMKGGVGKTTVTVNLAISLIKKGKNVLVVDTDPQFNCSQSLIKKYTGNLDAYFARGEHTIVSILKKWDRKLIQKDVHDIESPIMNLYHGVTGQTGILDLIPGSLEVITETNNTSETNLLSYFRKNEERFNQNYDFIIFDCAPTWGILTTAIFKIAANVIIPTTLDEFSTIGIRLLIEQLSTLVDAGDSINGLGVVYMMLSGTTRSEGISRKQEPLKRSLETFLEEEASLQIETELNPFDTWFYANKTVASTGAIYEDLNVSKNSTVKDEFISKSDALAQEVIERIENRNG